MIDKGVTLRSLPHRGIHIGSNVYLGRGVILDIPRTASLVIGDYVLITHYSVLAAGKGIVIGDHTQIGEMCSIRDSDHSMSEDLIRLQPLQSTPVSIGTDVWLGRGTAVLRGSTIGKGAVVGANSLVRGAISEMSVNVGNPSRQIGNRGREAGAT